MNGEIQHFEQEDVLEKLQDAAQSRIVSTPTGFLIAGIGAFFLFNMIALELAIAAAALPLYIAIKRAWKNGKNAEYMRRTGRFAHLLNDRELIRLTGAIGKDAVIAQLKEAWADGKPLTDSAIYYLERSGVDLDSYVDLEAHFKALEEGQNPAIDVPAQEVGAETRLNAIEVPVETPVIGQTSTVEPFSFGYAPQVSDQFLRDFAARPENLLLIATKGGGKGVVLSNYLRMRKAAEPRLVVLMIDPKNSEQELGYWNEPWIQRYAFNAAECSLEDILEHLTRAFGWITDTCSNAALADVPILIAIDECLATSEILRKLGRNAEEKNALSLKLALIASLLDASQRHLVAVTQSPNLGDIGISGGVALNFKKMILFRQDEADVLKKAHQTKLINLPSNVTDAYLKALCDACPLTVKRGIYLDGAFYAMPALTNYSGYDRDSRSYLPGYDPSPTVIQSQEPSQPQNIEEGDIDAPPLAEMVSYIQKKGGEIQIATVKQSWGKNKGLSADDIASMIGKLVGEGKARTYYPEGSKAEWIQILQNSPTPIAAPSAYG